MPGSRSLKLKVELDEGRLFAVLAKVKDRDEVILSDIGEAETEIPQEKTQLMLRFVGVPGSRIKVSIDLPGTNYDFSLEQKLKGNVQKWKMTV